MTRRPRVAWIDRGPPRGFMRVDRACLEQFCDVESLQYPGRSTPRYLGQSIQLARRADVLLSFFASEHTLAPALAFKLMRKRVVLICGGYDYANVPELRYGLLTRRRGWLPRFLGWLCDAALPISEQARGEFLGAVPSAAPKTAVVYLAVDPADWENPGVDRDPTTVVTVAHVTEESWKRKGIDRFVECAVHDPGRRYVLAGQIEPPVRELLAELAPANLEVMGFVDHDDLRTLLWSAGVYAQLSRHEGFGMAMAEAMACGCTPVITDLPALREVAETHGVVVRDGEGVVDAIRRAGSAKVNRRALRDYVTNRFDPERRAQALARAIQRVLTPP